MDLTCRRILRNKFEDWNIPSALSQTLFLKFLGDFKMERGSGRAPPEVEHVAQFGEDS